MCNSLSNKPDSKTWDEVAEEYNLELTDMELELAEEINTILTKLNINAKASLLELGSGSGHLSGILAKNGYDVTLLDFSENALEKSKQFFEYEKVTGKFIKADITALNDFEQKFDVVWNSGVMEHFDYDNLKNIFKNIRKNIKKAFVFLVPNPLSVPYLLFRYKLTKDEKWIYGTEFLRTNYREILEETGFKVIGQEFLGWGLTKSLMDMSYNDAELSNDLKELIKNRLLDKTNAYLTAYIAEPIESNSDVSNNVFISKNKNYIDSTKYLTEKFDTLAFTKGILTKLSIGEKKNDELNEKVLEKQNKIDELNEKALEKQNKIDELNEKALEKQNKIDELNEKALEKQNKIDELNEKNLKLLEEITGLEAQNTNIYNEFQIKIDALKQKNMDNKKKIEELLIEKFKVYKLEEENQIKDNEIQKINNDLKQERKVSNEKLHNMNNEIIKTKYELNQTRFELDLIHKSDFWKLALKYYKFRDNIWPISSIYRYVKNRNLKRKQLSNISAPENISIGENNNIQSMAVEMANEKENQICNITKKKYDKHDVLFFSVIDWGFRYQRPQHLAAYMNKEGHRVFYFNANFSTNTTEIKNNKDGIKEIILSNKLGDRVYDVDLNTKMDELSKEIDAFIIHNNINDCIMYIEYPTWHPVVEYIRNKYGFKLIFDYLDDFDGFNTNNQILVECTQKVFEISDYVVASSKYLFDKAKLRNSNVEIIRNGTEYAHFNKALNNNTSINKDRQIIGYYGAIAEWFEVDIVLNIAKQRPEWDIVLIGDYTYGNIEELKKLNNVKLLGEKNYQELPQYLQQFDVCLIPFDASTNLIKATNPVKFYEYLSAGKKIVATEIPELEEFRDEFVYLANDKDKFLEYVDKCVNNEDSLAPIEEKLEFALKQDWNERGNSITKVIEKVNPLVSIIIVTYNNLKYTKQCVNSIFDKTAYPNYEIIIVDNKSSDETPKYLKELGKNHSNIKVVLNEENYGFAKGNNIGIRYAKGEYIVLLNNDTLVTRGWVTGLVKHLERDEELGLIGPVTNSIGNESKINVDYTDIYAMDEFAHKYTTENFNKFYTKLDVLAMFCVAMRKEIFEEVGYLDEAFGLGMFEDDDYSYRIKEKGYKIACAEDVFIHHYGGASFKKIESEEYKRVFEENKRIFETKWNTKWIPHTYREGVQ